VEIGGLGSTLSAGEYTATPVVRVTYRVHHCRMSKQDFNARNILRIHWQSPPSLPLTVLEKRRKKHVLFCCFDPQKIIF
jgi:hypothetical protein